jgi:hypothetical protein
MQQQRKGPGVLQRRPLAAHFFCGVEGVGVQARRQTLNRFQVCFIPLQAWESFHGLEAEKKRNINEPPGSSWRDQPASSFILSCAF